MYRCADKKEKEDFIAAIKKKHRKTFTAWKVVLEDGRIKNFDYQYHQSRN